ncbi:hypothetical protein [Phycicoccus sp. Soil803]|uniref:hypothetical protein n=1 Tax=Phycicoccus sp. Soil803 TaxID=1736415 RepID=UPI00070EC443|nr:hypothetical protein [Phycicoccus sp. Soil803]KRF23819.1 hypothetical protein ASG95_03880 [Phycicoccus sp. Soil803]
MQPSSLVFLVIIAVWAAYFVQYWVRRREHLATARSVDQFSESMRVLERRSPLPASNLSTPQPRSYAVTPARAARPQVLVKRAETTPSTPTPSPAPTAPPAEDEAPTPRALPSARRTRAVIMLGALATVVVVGTLVAVSLVPLYAVAVPVVAVGAALAWSRADAQAQRRARLAARQASRRAGQPRPVAERRTAEPAPQTAPAAPIAETAPVTAGAEIADEVPTSAPVPVRGELYDVQAVETSLRQPAAARVATPVAAPAAPARPLVDEDDIPLTWDPVPVPRPTYTMKARVTRPAPTSADLVGDADTEYAAYDEAPERRVAGA